MCDDGDFSMGVVLGQRANKTFKALYYASKTLMKHKRIIQQLKEILAMVFACENFRPYILESHVIVHIDHEQLNT